MWELDHKEGFGAREGSWECLGLKGDQTSQSYRKSILNSLEGLMLKLKLQYFVHLMQRVDSLEKTLMLGKIEGIRRRTCQKMRWLDSITDSKNMTLSKIQEVVKNKGAWDAAVRGVTKSQTNLATEQQQWKQLRYPLENEWINKLWWVQTMDIVVRGY